jgi:hypothetical protein
MENEQLSSAITIGLTTLSSDDVKVSAKDVESLATFKEILRAILNGQLVLATPDRIIPEGVELPKEENENPVEED